MSLSFYSEKQQSPQSKWYAFRFPMSNYVQNLERTNGDERGCSLNHGEQRSVDWNFNSAVHFRRWKLRPQLRKLRESCTSSSSDLKFEIVQKMGWTWKSFISSYQYAEHLSSFIIVGAFVAFAVGWRNGEHQYHGFYTEDLVIGWWEWWLLFRSFGGLCK